MGLLEEHGLIRPRNQGSGALAGAPFHNAAAGPDPDGRRGGARLIAHFQGVDGLCQLGRLAQGVVIGGMGEDDAEFIPAEAADDIGFAGPVLQDAGDLEQNIIARSVAVDVIDQLEIVEIDEDQRKGRLEAAGKGDLAPDLALEGADFFFSFKNPKY